MCSAAIEHPLEGLNSRRASAEDTCLRCAGIVPIASYENIAGKTAEGKRAGRRGMIRWKVPGGGSARVEHPEKWLTLRDTSRCVFAHYSDSRCAEHPTADHR